MVVDRAVLKHDDAYLAKCGLVYEFYLHRIGKLPNKNDEM